LVFWKRENGGQKRLWRWINFFLKGITKGRKGEGK